MQPTLTPEYLASQELSVNFPKRFWEKVQKSDGCWLWAGALTTKGYGNIWRGIPKRPGFIYTIYSHRASWVIHNGPVPDGLQVLHRCDNPPCVNPDHLFLGTPKDNTQDMVKKGRAWTGFHHGILSGCAKLTDEKVRELRRRFKKGESNLHKLAPEFGVSEWTARNAVMRKTWKHVF